MYFIFYRVGDNIVGDSIFSVEVLFDMFEYS